MGKAQYDKDSKAFLDSGGEMKKRKSKDDGAGGKRRKTKDPNKPKRPAGGAYGVFLKKNWPEFAKQCPGKVTEVTKLASKKWKELSAAQKKPSEDEFKKLQAAYKEAMKNYKPPEGDGGEEGEDDD